MSGLALLCYLYLSICQDPAEKSYIIGQIPNIAINAAVNQNALGSVIMLIMTMRRVTLKVTRGFVMREFLLQPGCVRAPQGENSDFST